MCASYWGHKLRFTDKNMARTVNEMPAMEKI